MSNERHTVQTALDYIEDNIYEMLDGTSIAAACGLSVRHLYRLFSEYTGHTLKHYLRSRRLTLASQALIQSDTSIIDVAFSHQFQSPEVFTRAFRRAFWMTPSQFRKIGCQQSITQQPRISTGLLDYSCAMSNFNPEILQINTQRFCGIRTVQKNFGLRTQSNWRDTQLQIKHLQEVMPSHSVWQMFSRKNHQLLDTFDTMECIVGILQDTQSQLPSPFDTNWVYEKLPRMTYAKFPYNNEDVAYETMLQHAYKWLKESQFGHADAPTLFKSASQCGRFGLLLLPVTDQKLSNPMKWWHSYDAILKTELGPPSQ